MILARATVAHPLAGHQEILGDRGYRASIISARRDHCGQIIPDHTYRVHCRIRGRVEQVTARLKDWQILRHAPPR